MPTRTKQETNGKPQDVVLVTITVPLYVGEVPTNSPDSIDQLHYQLLKPEQCEGINRLWQGYVKTHADSPRQPTRAECARHLLGQLTEAFRDQHGVRS